jgi:Flp pilus assembly protein TadG
VRPLIRSTRHPRQKHRGAAAAELAMILPVLVAIVLGTVDFGRFAYNHIAVTNAARAGAAYAMMNNYSSSTLGTWVSNVTAAAKAEMTGQAGYNPANLTVAAPVVTVEAGGLRRVQLTVSYPFQTIVNWSWTGLSIPHTMTMQRTVVVRLIR